ncbi:MAG: sulfatase [Halanaerobium sp.]
MNILYIHTHDTGRYIEPYGYRIPTPNLMEFAQKATLFRQAFSTAPTCSPSRAGMLTGMSPHESGMIGLAHRGFTLNDYDKHIVNHLNKNGYKTVLCGMQHVASEPEMIGYDKIIGINEFGDMDDLKNAELAADFLEKDHDQPFFLSFGMEYTHRPFTEIADDIDPDYVKTPFPIHDNPQNREDMAKYMSTAQKADTAVGIVLEALAKNDLKEETLVIFTTDHGIAFPHMKCNLQDSGIGVSLIMDFPGNNKRGETVDSLISQLDIYPTICDILEIESPEWLQGNSILPIFKEEKEEIRDEIFAEVTYHAAYEPMRAIRTKRYKYIKYFDEKRIIPANIDDSPAKDFLLENGYLEKKHPQEYLFDLYFDPTENQNLINDSDYQDIYQNLKTRLKKWMKNTDDPLLKEGARVPKPEGAVVNKKECLSAEEDDFE